MEKTITQRLQHNLQKTFQYFDLPEKVLLKSYGENKWNIHQILCHLTDAETVLYDRIRRTIANPGQTVMGFEQNLWAEKLEYETFPPKLSKDLFIANRKAVIQMASKYYERYGNNKVTHSEAGPRTLKDFFDKILWHNEQHLAQAFEGGII